jgi:hypothetical protein
LDDDGRHANLRAAATRPPLFFARKAAILVDEEGQGYSVPVKPVAKCAYVCDDVTYDPVTGKVSLLNLWDTIRVPNDAAFPYVLDRICVFVWWRDGFGKSGSRVEIVQASTEETIRRTRNCILNFEGCASSVYARYKIEKCRFPETGYYHVEVYCENQFVDDQIIRVESA